MDKDTGHPPSCVFKRTMTSQAEKIFLVKNVKVHQDFYVYVSNVNCKRVRIFHQDLTF